jgi:hypothetical protein
LAKILDLHLRNGCAYVVCGGNDAPDWEEVADECHVAQGGAAHVMTTSHPGETLSQVMTYATTCTGIGQVRLLELS